jgi:succinyl-diaminopimelate desuccinylase
MDVKQKVNSERKEMIRVLSGLIAADTTTPPGNEWRAAEVVKKFFRKERIRYKIFEKEKGRTNIIGYVGKGKPRLIIACHSDVVPAGDGWKSDPFRAKISKDRVYGRGAVDNKGPLASMLITGKVLKHFEKQLKGQVILACVADEEKGSKYGMYYLLKEKKLHGEYAIVPDIERDMKKIDIAEKGLLHLKVTSFGKQAHGSRPHTGINAVWNMIEFLNLFKKYRMKFKKHGILSDPTSNLGMIKGGSAPNIVPGECEACIDFRYVPSQKAKGIINDIKKMLAQVRKKNRKARFRLEVIDNQRPSEVEKDNVLVRKIRKHSKDVIRIKPVITGLSGTTVVKPLVQSGILSVGFSPGKNMAHAANENVSVRDLLDFSKIMCLVCLDLLS